MTSEWFTPVPILERARRVLGTIDLDPASCAVANERVGAGVFHGPGGVNDDGLTAFRWCGSVWLNPPSPALPWWARLIEARGDVEFRHALFLAFNAELLQTSQGRSYPPIAAFPMCAPAKRIRFVRPDGTPGASPRHHSLIVYVPGTVDRRWAFCDAFADLGAVLLPGGQGARSEAP